MHALLLQDALINEENSNVLDNLHEDLLSAYVLSVRKLAYILMDRVGAW